MWSISSTPSSSKWKRLHFMPKFEQLCNPWNKEPLPACIIPTQHTWCNLHAPIANYVSVKRKVISTEKTTASELQRTNWTYTTKHDARAHSNLSLPPSPMQWFSYPVNLQVGNFENSNIIEHRRTPCFTTILQPLPNRNIQSNHPSSTVLNYDAPTSSQYCTWRVQNIVGSSHLEDNARSVCRNKNIDMIVR